MPLINTRGAASIKGFGFAGFSPKVPGAPTSVSASATSCSAISVSFTAPACNGGLSIDYYQVVCTSSGTHSATGSSPISVTGLCASTSYTFKVRAHNSIGYGSYSSSTGTATTNAATGSVAYTSSGRSTFVVPSSVTSISILAIGNGGHGANRFSIVCCGQTYTFSGGGGNGGSLAYKNNYSVTPSNSHQVCIVAPGGCNSGAYLYTPSGLGVIIYAQCYNSSSYAGCSSSFGGGFGGIGGQQTELAGYPKIGGGGGAGAGGYGSPGTNNGGNYGSPGCVGTYGSGGGGAAGSNSTPTGGGGGGGAGIYGSGSNGTAGSYPSSSGGGGSGGSSGSSATGCIGGNGGAYGGGPGGSSDYGGSNGLAGGGVIRIVWPGTSRQWPSTSVGSP